MAVVARAGGAAPALMAVAAVASGTTAATTASGIAAGAFIGSATAFGFMAIDAAYNSTSFKDFNEQGNWGTVLGTGIGGIIGATVGYFSSRNQKVITQNTKNSWGNPETLQDHFDRHGADFNALTSEDYANKANAFYNNRANYQVKTDTSGIIRVYDADTNTFGSYNSNGTTKTFFKPSAGQGYFDRQPGQ